MKATHDMDALIGKFLAGEASPEEAMFLEDWKAESEENQRHFAASERILGISGAGASEDRAWQKVKALLAEDKPQPMAPVRKLKRVFFFRAAAAIVVLVLAGALLLPFLQADPIRVFTAGNSHKQVKLSDGTSIDIARHSSVKLANGYGTDNRSVDLKGSGYFTVDHNEQLPFIVNAGPIHIKDLGTKFDVKETKDTIFIRVDEGEVLIYDNNGTKITLKASESAHYIISTRTLEIAVQTTGKPNATKVFVFKDRRLSEVIAALRVAYQAEITISNPASGNCLITTQFNDEDLDVALSVIAETLGLTVVKEQEVYILNGASCVY